MKNKDAGITIIEMLFALMILVLLVMISSNFIVSTQQDNQRNQQRNQVSQILLGLGRRVIASNTAVLPASPATAKAFTSSDLTNLGFQNTLGITASVTTAPNMTYGGTTFSQYVVQVCWKTTCVKNNVVAGGS